MSPKKDDEQNTGENTVDDPAVSPDSQNDTGADDKDKATVNVDTPLKEGSGQDVPKADVDPDDPFSPHHTQAYRDSAKNYQATRSECPACHTADGVRQGSLSCDSCGAHFAKSPNPA